MRLTRLTANLIISRTFQCLAQYLPRYIARIIHPAIHTAITFRIVRSRRDVVQGSTLRSDHARRAWLARIWICPASRRVTVARSLDADAETWQLRDGRWSGPSHHPRRHRALVLNDRRLDRIDQLATELRGEFHQAVLGDQIALTSVR